MAVEEAILEAVIQGISPPTLRLYEWHPPCLSIGYAQNSAEVDLERLTSRGWLLVRRPTGGRAILHTDELTYSVIGPESDPRLSGTVLECYRKLAEALVQALKLLNIHAEIQESPINQAHQPKNNPICFEVPSNYEITTSEKKLLGSAQARKKGGVLQHGSLPLHGDLTRITQVLKYPDEISRALAARRLLERATTVEGVLGYCISFEATAQAFLSAFSQVLKIDFIYSELSAQEQDRAEQLMQEKYNHPSWTFRI